MQLKSNSATFADNFISIFYKESTALMNRFHRLFEYNGLPTNTGLPSTDRHPSGKMNRASDIFLSTLSVVLNPHELSATAHNKAATECLINLKSMAKGRKCGSRHSHTRRTRPPSCRDPAKSTCSLPVEQAPTPAPDYH